MATRPFPCTYCAHDARTHSPMPMCTVHAEEFWAAALVYSRQRLARIAIVEAANASYPWGLKDDVPASRIVALPRTVPGTRTRQDGRPDGRSHQWSAAKRAHMGQIMRDSHARRKRERMEKMNRVAAFPRTVQAGG